MSRCTPRQAVSLKSILPKSQILGASDVLCHACHCEIDSLKASNAQALSKQNDEPANRSVGQVLFLGVSDSHDYARMVVEGIANGATAIVTEQFLPCPVPQCIVPDVNEAFAIACNAVHNNPTHKVLTIGVVGTHGKTTAALLTASMLKSVGSRVGYTTSLGGSNGAETGLRCEPDANAKQLVELVTRSAANNCPAVVIELTDDILCSKAASGFEFDVLLFTSLRKSQRTDKLRARGVENAMQRLVGQLKGHGVVVYNADDARLNRWIERHQPHAIGYGLDAACDVMGTRIRRNLGRQSMMIQMGRSITPLTSRLIGDHNARHILGAAAIGYAFGLEVDEIVCGLERLQRVPGRLQPIPSKLREVYIDVADQADRLAVSLHALRVKNGAPIVCVAEVPEGATPDQLMAYGRVLERAAGKVFLTQSRTTAQAGQIGLWQVLDGCDRPAAIEIVPNRETAIELAIRSAGAGDQILLAGWGTNGWTNNQTDEVKTDHDVAEAVLAALNNEPDPAPKQAAVDSRPVFKIFDAA